MSLLSKKNKYCFNTKSSKKGFSTIELAIVSIIIAILIGTIAMASRLMINAKIATARSLTYSSPVKDIDNLILWVEATKEESFKKSDVLDGTISIWYDLSGNKNHPHREVDDVLPDNVSSATVDNDPIYTEEAINGLPALRFPYNNSKFLRYEGSALIKSDYTIFVVEQRNSNRHSNYFLAGWGNTQYGNLVLGYRDIDTITQDHYLDPYNITIDAYSSPIPRIHSFTFDLQGGKKYYLNGTIGTICTINCRNQLINYSFATIGRYHGDQSSFYFNGDIGEVIIYNKLLTEEERKDVEVYLSKKWAI